MRELGPARAYFATRLGNGDYAKGAAILDEKLEEARQIRHRIEVRKTVAGFNVGIAVVMLAAVVIVMGSSASPLSHAWWLVLAMPFLYLSIAQFVAIDSYVRFGRPPHTLARLLPGFLDVWWRARFTVNAIDAGNAFDGLKSRELVVRAGGHEIDPALFDDRIWPFLLSSDEKERQRAACPEYGYCGEEIVIFEVSSEVCPANPSAHRPLEQLTPLSEPVLAPAVPDEPGAAAHVFQRIPEEMKERWIDESVGRKGYALGTRRHTLLVAVLGALWDEIRAPNWQGRKLINIEIARRCHDRVVTGGLGFLSTELTAGKPSTEPADWIQKVITGRARDYRFAVEAAEAIVSESPERTDTADAPPPVEV